MRTWKGSQNSLMMSWNPARTRRLWGQGRSSLLCVLPGFVQLSGLARRLFYVRCTSNFIEYRKEVASIPEQVLGKENWALSVCGGQNTCAHREMFEEGSLGNHEYWTVKIRSSDLSTPNSGWSGLTTFDLYRRWAGGVHRGRYLEKSFRKTSYRWNHPSMLIDKKKCHFATGRGAKRTQNFKSSYCASSTRVLFSSLSLYPNWWKERRPWENWQARQ